MDVSAGPAAEEVREQKRQRLVKVRRCQLLQQPRTNRAIPAHLTPRDTARVAPAIRRHLVSSSAFVAPAISPRLTRLIFGPINPRQAARSALDADLLKSVTLKEQAELEFLEALGVIAGEKGGQQGAADAWRKKEVRTRLRPPHRPCLFSLASAQSTPNAHSVRPSLPLRAPHPPALPPAQVRVNTALYYKQSKYQNVREEPEGFAKLITVVNNFGAAALSEATLPGVRKTVLSLIGYFDLDANRALDIILDRRVAGAGGSSPFLTIAPQLLPRLRNPQQHAMRREP